MDARDAVAERDDAADFGDIDVDGVAADLLADDFGYFFGFDVHRTGSRLLPFFEALFDPLQLARDARVVDGIAHPRDQTADDVRVDRAWIT